MPSSQTNQQNTKKKKSPLLYISENHLRRVQSPEAHVIHADNWPQAHASTAWCCDNTAFLGALRKGYSAYVPSEENPVDALSRQFFDPASYPIGTRVSSNFLQNLQFRDVDWRGKNEQAPALAPYSG